jgi:hypothetical protein
MQDSDRDDADDLHDRNRGQRSQESGPEELITIEFHRLYGLRRRLKSSPPHMQQFGN